MSIPISLCMIGKNEEVSLPRSLKSLEEFRRLGGDMVFIDTGSTDRTADIAEAFGMRTYREGDRFVISVTKEEADYINKEFVIKGEEDIIWEGMKLFHYSAARNYGSSLAKHDYIIVIDCDEVFTNLDIPEIIRLFDKGYSHIHYDYVWSHYADGSPQTRFFSGSRLYNRIKVRWVGYVHETLAGEDRGFVAPSEVVRVDHWGRYKPATAKYLATLAYALYKDRNNDRNLHYFGRELFFNKRYNSAVKILGEHVALNRWDLEKQQSMIFIGDCYMALGREDDAVDIWFRAFHSCGKRREPIMRIAEYYHKKNNLRLTAAYASMALGIKREGFYATQEDNYTWKPHYLLYLALWWLGDKAGSKYHFDRCLKYNPHNKLFLNHTKFYYPAYPDNGIEGWMTFPELYWLFRTAKHMDTVLEIGNWKGRSTHALLSSGAKVTAVDHFQGSADPNDLTNRLAKEQDIYAQFIKNVGHFKNLTLIKKSSEDAAKFTNKKFDMVFIDGSHLYQDILRDIKLWMSKAKKMICGHDYSSAWPEVIKAVNEVFGKPDEIVESIWIKYIA